MAKKHGHHGGAWKVAYADFVTAMMALFLVLWLTAQDTKIKEAIERAFRNPFSSATKESMGIIPNKELQATHDQKGTFESVNAVEMELLRKITEDLAKMFQSPDESANSVKLQLTSEGLRVNIFDRSRKPIFERDSSKLTEYGKWVISTLAWEVARYTTFYVEVNGHTETGRKPLNADYGDWELSADRANAARRLLLQNGVRPKQIAKVAGFGDTQQFEGSAPEDEINRRVTVLLKVQQPETAQHE
ncbi:MAG TPA: flagellar motor protein MotB [Candidatus Acidoferrum sp.]|nr:flagellar motor protein MotB [Candidatus Acidoferrum sp.]